MIQVPLTNSDKFAIVDDGWKEDVLENGQKWFLDNCGYVQSTSISGFPEYRCVFLHHLIIGDEPGMDVDHISGDKLDNRKANLRHVTRSQNMMNIRTRSDNRTGVKGVCNATTQPSKLGRKHWRARITVNGKLVHLGWFSTFEEACAARKEAEQRFHGEYARNQ